jgi:signal transduction histidine kinase
VVAVLLLFAFASGFLVEQHIDSERQRNESAANERLEAWGDLIQRSLPGRCTRETQATALREWSQKLRFPLALDDAQRRTHRRFGLVPAGHGRGDDQALPGQVRRRTHALDLSGRAAAADREQRASRRARPRAAAAAVAAAAGQPPRGAGLAIVLVVLFIAIAAGAYPVVRRLTRRLEALKQGVEQFGAGQLSHRVEVSGNDEVAAVASSFNVAAQRVEALVQSHKSLLANASHELRSPLARMKMAVSMLEGAAPAQRDKLKPRSTATSPSSTRWSRRCCSPAGSTVPRIRCIATGSTCSPSPPRRRRGSMRRSMPKARR